MGQGEDTRPRVGILSSAPSRKGLAVEKGSLSSPEARKREWVTASGSHRGFRSCYGAPFDPSATVVHRLYSGSEYGDFPPPPLPSEGHGAVSLPCWLWRLLCFLV